MTGPISPTSPSSKKIDSSPTASIPEAFSSSVSEKALLSLDKYLQGNPSEADKLVDSLSAKIQLNIINPELGTTKIWVIDLSCKGNAKVYSVDDIEKKACKVLIQGNENTIVKLMQGSLSPEFAFMAGDLTIKGAMAYAIKFKEVLGTIKNLQ